MCFVITVVIGALAVSLWMHAQPLYAAVTGAVALTSLFFSARKIVKNGPCLFGKRRDC